MFRRIAGSSLAILILFTAASCGVGYSRVPVGDGSGPVNGASIEGGSDPGDGDDGVVASPPEQYKVGIITGSPPWYEEEFFTAQKMIRDYGEEKIITASWPDDGDEGPDTLAALAVSLADRGAKAILVCLAAPDIISAASKVRETHPDLLFVAGFPTDSPRETAAIADVCLLIDEVGMGGAIAMQAAKMGAKTFVHYSFPRHLLTETVAARVDQIARNCARLDVRFVNVMAPDPEGDSGVIGARRFIAEDVPRQVQAYGSDTAFFASSCVMQMPLIRGVLDTKTIFPQQCCPGPFHGYPAALEISTDGHEDDPLYMLDQIRAKVAAAGNSGGMSVWPVPGGALIIESGTDYCIRYCEGAFVGRHNDAELRRSFDRIAGRYKTSVTLSRYADTEGEMENFYLLLSGYADL